MPEMDIRPLRDDVTNVEWLNAIRNEAGYDYQRRIPEATQANVQDVVQNLMEFRPLMNEFINVLVNRIGLVLFKNTLWTNPLAKFKRGMLTHGDTIEEIMTGLLEATVYDPDRDELEKEIFGAMTPEVQASYHKVNRRNRYKLTVKEPLLRQAFTSNDGLSRFITDLMSAPQTSDQWDEFLLMANLFKEYERAGGFFKVQVGDVGAQESDSNDSRFMLRRLREFANTLPFISRQYNAAGMPVAANPDELELFVTADADAAMDVEALAGAFNIDRMNFASRKTVIPAQYFGIEGVQAILTTRDFFVVADQLITTTTAQNPAALLTNYWLHHWEVISASRFVPAILFSTQPGDVIVIPDTPVTGVENVTVRDDEGTTVTSVERGTLYTVGADVTTDGVNTAVRWELEGAESTFTKLSQTGVLYVAPNESAGSLTIKAYAVDTDIPQLEAEATVTVTGDLLTLWPNPSVGTDSDNDGLIEVTPEALTMDENNVVTIPAVVGVQYRKAGVAVNNGSTHEITAETTFDAVARSGHELTAGTYTWTFTPSA